MKRHKRRLPIPQHEFGFTPDTFNLMAETGLDGDRITRERAEAELLRRRADEAQGGLFAFTIAQIVDTNGHQNGHQTS